MYFYREKDNLIYRLHPASMVFFSLLMLILAMLFSHPLCLLSFFLSLSMVIISSGNFREWKIYLKYSLFMMSLIVALNAVVSQNGTTVLWEIPFIQRTIYLESIAYAVGMSLRLLIIISTFCLFTYAVNPDKVIGMCGHFGYKSALVLSLSARLFPLMINDFKKIMEVQHCRGVSFDKGNWLERIKKYLPLCGILLISSLERALEMSAAMYARAYGSGKATVYSREYWHPADYGMVIILTIAFIIGIWASLQGIADYSYYPFLARIDKTGLYTAVAMMILLVIPAILNWGWMKWPSLRSKI